MFRSCLAALSEALKLNAKPKGAATYENQIDYQRALNFAATANNREG
jgi:hypothetical protein